MKRKFVDRENDTETINTVVLYCGQSPGRHRSRFIGELSAFHELLSDVVSAFRRPYVAGKATMDRRFGTAAASRASPLAQFAKQADEIVAKKNRALR